MLLGETGAAIRQVRKPCIGAQTMHHKHTSMNEASKLLLES
jgi:hypothetical protein